VLAQLELEKVVFLLLIHNQLFELVVLFSNVKRANNVGLDDVVL
jgi:hypothetical protein